MQFKEMQFMVKIFFFLLFSCVLFGQELITTWASNAGKLNPHLYSPNQMYAQMMVYQSLVSYNGEIQGDVAESWEISEDGKQYTFKIKDNLKFSDGSALDAYAIQKNFDAILDNKARHSWLGITQKITHTQALDAKTFQITLNSPYIAALYELSLPRPYRFIAPSAMINGSTKDGIKAPIGSGAWVLDKSILGVEDVFVQNPYFLNPHPSLTKITIKVLPDANARILALRSGSIDMILGRDSLSKESFTFLSRDKNFKAITSEPQGTLSLAINASKDRITNAKPLREALSYAINKDIIWKQILLEIDAPAKTLFNPALPFANVGLSGVSFNPQRSAEILEEEGWKINPKDKMRYKGQQKLEIQLTYIGKNPTQKAISEAIQNDLAKVGIALKLIPTEEITFYQTQTNGNFDLIFNETWGKPFDPHSFISSMLTHSHADFETQKDLPNIAQIRQTIQKILNDNSIENIQEYYRVLLKDLQDAYIYFPISYQKIPAVYNAKKIKSYQLGAMENSFLFERIELY